MLLYFKVRYEGAVPGSVNLRKRTFNRIKKDAWEAVGKYWHKHLRPKHFTRAGAREYNYAPRKGQSGNPHPKGFWASYTGQKHRKKHHRLPLVYSGELRSMARQARISATSKGVRVALSRAQKANLRHPKSKINMADELTRVSPAEIKKLIQVHEKYMDYRLRRVQGTTTERIG